MEGADRFACVTPLMVIHTFSRTCVCVCVSPNQHLVDSHFDVLQRRGSTGSLADIQNDFVTLASCTVANRGLPEYNVFGGTYELTLIRATSKMGDWGPFQSAPSSQEQGIHHFEYAVIPHSAVHDKDNGAQALARCFTAPMATAHMKGYSSIMSSNPVFDLENTALKFVERAIRPRSLDPDEGKGGPGRGRGRGGPGGGGGGNTLPNNGQMFDLQPSNQLVVSAVKVSEQSASGWGGPFQVHSNATRGAVLTLTPLHHSPTMWRSVQAQTRTVGEV